ncbi:MAG: hypothetical protein ABSB82_06990 [Terriglobia bacterium]|jgi:hypothetical protein
MSELNVEFDSARAACRQFDLDLPAYLEGEDRPRVASHAQECAFCGVVLADLELIRSRSSELLLEDPPARVWANLHATLAAEGYLREPQVVPQGGMKWFPSLGEFHLMRYAAPFAAMACLILAATLLTIRTNQNHVSRTSSPQASVPVNAPEAAVNAGLVESVSAMEKSYREREKFLDPSIQASYRKGLKSLDDSIRECRDSLDKEPTDAVAREYLASAYQQKAAVLFAALEYDGR